MRGRGRNDRTGKFLHQKKYCLTIYQGFVGVCVRMRSAARNTTSVHVSIAIFGKFFLCGDV